MRSLGEYIKGLESKTLRYLLDQYKWEEMYNLDNHNKKIMLIENELNERGEC